MPIVYTRWIRRADLKAHLEDRFVFGDNVKRAGMGGQAAAMRGEPNAIGVATKWAPSNTEGAFFSDAQAKAWEHLQADLARVEVALHEGRTVHVPYDGLGTGLSQLPMRAPRMYAHLRGCFDLWSGGACPWPPA